MSEKLKIKENQSNYEEKSLKSNYKKIKNNWKGTTYITVKSIISNLAFLLVGIAFFKRWFLLVVFLIITLEILYAILKWNYEYLVLEENEARYYRGVISKETLIIPEKSFKSMDLSQNLIEKILGYKKVKIESPSKKLEIEDIELLLNDEQIKLLKNFALGEKNKLNNEVNLETINKINTEEGKKQLKVYDEYNSQDEKSSQISHMSSNLNEVYSLNKGKEKDFVLKEKKVSSKELILYGFTSFNLFVAIVFLENFKNKIKNFISDDYLNNLFGGNIENILNGFSLALIIIGALILLIILKVIVSIYYFIKYYDFTLSKERDNIKINYGFFSTKEFSFKENNIKLIKIKSNPLRQLLKRCEINVVIKGYSGSGNEKIIMYPIASKEETQDILKEFTPEWVFDEEVNRINCGKLVMVIKPCLIVFIISVIAYLIFKISWIFMINLISIVIIPNAILKGRNLGLKVGEKLVKAIKGGFFKTIYILKGKDIQAVLFKTNPIQVRNGVGKITIDYYSEVSEEIELPYMKKEYIKELLRISKGK